ncbi:ACT domain-containing protein ACR8-like [Zingiber officinale]|nr:ACT domain-containing protein ACR8-like [Zingiber officinale]
MELRDEYQKLVHVMMNTPRVAIDNAMSPTATVVRVNSARKRGMLLEVVQVLADLNLRIQKGYISSDGRWFMDVFHVVDERGQKLLDPALVSLIERSLVGETSLSEADGGADGSGLAGLTALELTGTDRPGLLSEVFAVLRDLECNIVEAKVWTHNARIASLIFVKDIHTGSPIADGHRIHRIESRLGHVLRGDHDVRSAKTAVSSPTLIHSERRLHQLMFADRDYERLSTTEDQAPSSSSQSKPSVSVQNWAERSYSVVSVQCRDRPKLLFDVACTLTDMDYVVFHGTLGVDADRAYQEFYIRHVDGGPISSEAERQRVIQCVQAAIERRASVGARLSLKTPERRGLLAEATRIFRENGLSIKSAEITTKDGEAKSEFCVTDTGDHLPDRRSIHSVIEKIGEEHLTLSEHRAPWSYGERPPAAEAVGSFNLGNLVKRNLYYLGLVRSCS